jgi:hypothetical protein
MAVISINYEGGNNYDDDGNVISNDMVYRGVSLFHGGKTTSFKSGNFVKDWYDAKRKYLELVEKNPNNSEYEYLAQSSTCDHFQSDGGKFDSGYLHMVDNKPVLKYVDDTDPNWVFTQREIFDNGWEFFVPEGTKPTWEELKQMCI